MNINNSANQKNRFGIPLIGFGTWQLTSQECYHAVRTALEIGYRHIDTAHIYGNHREVGEAIIDSGIHRKDLFVTSKLWLDEMGEGQVEIALSRSLDELQLNYLDLYLIHWPNKNVDIENTLKQMDASRQKGLTKNIGVSNFGIKSLKSAILTGINFINNQVEFHPSLYQKELLEFCKLNNISLTAYSPLAQGQDLEIPQIIEISQKYNKTPAQIILKSLVQQNIVAIPKASSKVNIESNFDIFDFNLEPKDIEILSILSNNNRIINPSFSNFE
jgi:2,5-diketo-D-gluconate reductase B